MTKRKPKIAIEFAVVSVKAGRRVINKLVGDHRGDGVKVPVTLTGHLVYAWGHDDGVDQEFAMQVDAAMITIPEVGV